VQLLVSWLEISKGHSLCLSCAPVSVRAFSACTVLACKKICGFPLTLGTGVLFCEFRETRTGPCVEPVFFRAQGRADLGQIK